LQVEAIAADDTETAFRRKIDRPAFGGSGNQPIWELAHAGK
jgi:hypothetical protein